MNAWEAPVKPGAMVENHRTLMGLTQSSTLKFTYFIWMAAKNKSFQAQKVSGSNLQQQTTDTIYLLVTI